jgi:putative SOS response-associated peptidase YedK
MEPIHDRMPVILHPRDYDRWLTDYDESRPPIDLLHSSPKKRSNERQHDVRITVLSSRCEGRHA